MARPAAGSVAIPSWSARFATTTPKWGLMANRWTLGRCEMADDLNKIRADVNGLRANRERLKKAQEFLEAIQASTKEQTTLKWATMALVELDLMEMDDGN